MPSIPNISGSTSTAVIWKTSVLKNDIAADIAPLFRAVKNEDANILNPDITNENANILKACFVSSNSSLSYPTNICDSGAESVHAAHSIKIPPPNISTTLFLSIPFNSS